MFLECRTRQKDGQEQRFWAVIASRRVGRSVEQRHVLYLGESNDSQRAAAQKSIAVVEEQQGPGVPVRGLARRREPPSLRPLNYATRSSR